MKKRLIFLFLYILSPLTLLAQRISRDYHDCPMTEVLSDLSHATARQRIIFIYNDLEDFTVTKRFESLTLSDAIRACIGHYPISLTSQGDSILLVECTQKTKYKLIGRLVDEKGNPITDANITLTDNTAVTARGISNLNGRFVIPTNLSEGTIHITHVAFQPLNRHYTAGNIGTLHLKPANISLDSVQITTNKPHYDKSRYSQYAEKIEKEVWDMKLPQFHIDTLPMQYRHTPAVILADYDCIEYHLAERKTSTLANRNEKWIRTKHFHRTRYYINSQQAANSLSYVPYSLRTDITDFTYHKITVMGIRIIKPDGRINTINTQPYFKPKIRSRRNPTNDTDTIHVELLEPGDILDVFIYHNFQEPISPYQLAAPIGYPLLNYEGRAIVDVQLWLKYAGTFPKEQTTLEEQNGQYVLLCKLCDDSGSAKGLPQIMDISVEILK